MNSIFIIAHAPLARALRECALHVYPDCASGVVAFDVQPHLPPEETLAAARIAMASMGTDSTLVLTDVFGA
ncbi:MAG: PTS fructose transporter subunit IIA, partial [Rhodoferax sp.]